MYKVAFNTYIYKSGSYQDISDYVTECSDIPFIDRNRDYSIRAKQITMTLSDTVTYVPGPSDKIKIEYSGTIVYIGRVKQAKHIRVDRVYEVEVLNRLLDLKNYVVDFDTLQADLMYNNKESGSEQSYTVDVGTDVITAVSHGLPNNTIIVFHNSGGTVPGGLTETSNYIVGDVTADTFKVYVHTDFAHSSPINITDTGTGTNTFYLPAYTGGSVGDYSFADGEFSTSAVITSSSVRLRYLLERMAVIAGMTFTTSNLAYPTQYFKGSIIGNFTVGDYTADFTGNDFAIDTVALYDIGQAVVQDARVPNSDSAWIDKASKLTFFDFISLVFKSMNMFFLPIGADAYEIRHAPGTGEAYTITDDNLLDYIDTDVAAEYSAYVFKMGYGASSNYRLEYYDNNSDALLYPTNEGEGTEQISWVNNIAFLFIKYVLGVYNGVCAAAYWTPTSLGNSGDNVRFTRHLITDYTEERIETEITLTVKGVIENYLDFQNQTSKIIQETY